jgi:2-dehydropantoate 2-reductase
LCDEKTVVCVLQNGVEQQAQFADRVAGATVLPAVVWFPAQRNPMPPSGCARRPG